VRQGLAVERVLPGQQATDPVVEEPETSEPAIVPAVHSGLGAVQATEELAIVRVAGPALVRARERRIVPVAVQVRALDPVPG
jgi:hypothetical protein